MTDYSSKLETLKEADQFNIISFIHQIRKEAHFYYLIDQNRIYICGLIAHISDFVLKETEKI